MAAVADRGALRFCKRNARCARACSRGLQTAVFPRSALQSAGMRSHNDRDLEIAATTAAASIPENEALEPKNAVSDRVHRLGGKLQTGNPGNSMAWNGSA